MPPKKKQTKGKKVKKTRVKNSQKQKQSQRQGNVSVRINNGGGGTVPQYISQPPPIVPNWQAFEAARNALTLQAPANPYVDQAQMAFTNWASRVPNSVPYAQPNRQQNMEPVRQPAFYSEPEPLRPTQPVTTDDDPMHGSFFNPPSVQRSNSNVSIISSITEPSFNVNRDPMHGGFFNPPSVAGQSYNLSTDMQSQQSIPQSVETRQETLGTNRQLEWEWPGNDDNEESSMNTRRSDSLQNQPTGNSFTAPQENYEGQQNLQTPNDAGPNLANEEVILTAEERRRRRVDEYINNNRIRQQEYNSQHENLIRQIKEVHGVDIPVGYSETNGGLKYYLENKKTGASPYEDFRDPIDILKDDINRWKAVERDRQRRASGGEQQGQNAVFQQQGNNLGQEMINEQQALQQAQEQLGEAAANNAQAEEVLNAVASVAQLQPVDVSRIKNGAKSNSLVKIGNDYYKKRDILSHKMGRPITEAEFKGVEAYARRGSLPNIPNNFTRSDASYRSLVNP